tara:strand:+ start:123 stop:482 length:360 start_codon:yes stop_codon:yes gene_type:complete
MSDLPVIDPEAISNLRELSPDDDSFIIEIIDIFLEDTPKRIAELESSLASQDAEVFERAAHSIKGSSANLGAMPLRGIAEKIEHHARNEGIGGTEEMLAELKARFAEAKVELDKIAGRG